MHRQLSAICVGLALAASAACTAVRHSTVATLAWLPQAQGQGGAGAKPPETATETAPETATEAAPLPQQQDEPRTVRRLTRQRPPARDDGPSRFRFEAGFGYGRQDVGAVPLGARDAEDAFVFHWSLDFWANRHLGFGIRSDLADTVGELFEGQSVFDGQTTRPADAELAIRDFSAHFAWNPLRSDRVRLPLQVGPTFIAGALDYDRANIDYDWGGLGIRVGVRPEVVLIDGRTTDLTLYTGASYGVGFASVREDLVGRDEDYDTEFQNLRAEAGVRVEFPRFLIGLSYVYTDTGVNLSDIERGQRTPDIDYDTHMFMLTFGGRF